jgi:hypothetical protein
MSTHWRLCPLDECSQLRYRRGLQAMVNAGPGKAGAFNNSTGSDTIFVAT